VIKSRRMRWARHVAHGFWWGNPKERDHLKDLSVDIRITSRSGMRVMKWIELAQDRDMWRTFVKAVMNLRFA
jgi:hypothetical protein